MTAGRWFHIIIDMEKPDALAALSALAQKPGVAIDRLLGLAYRTAHGCQGHSASRGLGVVACVLFGAA